MLLVSIPVVANGEAVVGVVGVVVTGVRPTG
jgi:hypothetical protein